MNIEKDFYSKISNWDFYKQIEKASDSNSIILDLGTGGGERVLEDFPIVKKIIATDFSNKMIETANSNLLKTGKNYIEFKVMDNLDMNVPNDYFDIVTARHTCIDAKQIYNSLKKGGRLILKGVDKLDCWNLKTLFKKGQAFNDLKPISLIDYENIIEVGFRNVELIPIHIREYYKTKEDLIALLLKTPILNDFSESTDNQEKINKDLLNKYIAENTTNKGILLIRRYYGITAIKK